MPSRRRRLATLRLVGSPTGQEIDGYDDTGMDAPLEPNEAGRDAARSRTAPAFCQPKPVSPRPYQSLEPVVLPPPVDPEDEFPVDEPPRPVRWRDALARARSPQVASKSATHAARRPPTPARSEPPMAAHASLYDDPPMARRTPPPAYSPPPAPPALDLRPIWDDDVAERDDEASNATGPAWTALGRGVALLLGTLLAVDLFATGGLPADGPWWLDMRPLPEAVSAALLGLSAAVLIAFAARPALPGPIRTIAMLCVGLLIVVALKNATVYYGLIQRGDLHAGPPVAFSLHIAGCLGVVLLSLRAAAGPTGVRGSLLVLVGFNAALVTLPIAQIACTGPIDARRPASAAVVWAPRPFEHEPEQRLDARLKTAVELHQSGLAGKVILAGNPSGERLERLHQIAHEAGVPESAIEVLPARDDRATFEQLQTRFPVENGVTPALLAVSDFDHLPRIVTAARHAGLPLSPVPASTERPDRTVLLRETVELWRCYFRR
ncbi:MAG: ElyC/SanA/YdcF family protein [Planctomycetaceae bacterium]